MRARDVLLAAGAERRPQDPDAFLLGSRFLADLRRGQSWEARQERVLEALLRQCDGPWLLASDDVEAQPGWHRVDPQTVALPPGLTASVLLALPAIAYGSWALYAAPGPVALEDLPDAFKQPAAARTWFAAQPLSALLVAWPDNTDWALYLTPELDPAPDL